MFNIGLIIFIALEINFTHCIYETVEELKKASTYVPSLGYAGLESIDDPNIGYSLQQPSYDINDDLYETVPSDDQPFFMRRPVFSSLTEKILKDISIYQAWNPNHMDYERRLIAKIDSFLKDGLKSQNQLIAQRSMQISWKFDDIIGNHIHEQMEFHKALIHSLSSIRFYREYIPESSDNQESTEIFKLGDYILPAEWLDLYLKDEHLAMRRENLDKLLKQNFFDNLLKCPRFLRVDIPNRITEIVDLILDHALEIIEKVMHTRDLNVLKDIENFHCSIKAQTSIEVALCHGYTNVLLNLNMDDIDKFAQDIV